MTTAVDPAALLRQHGVQVTAQRLAVLRVLICRTCNRMVDVDCATGDAPCLIAADRLGYEIDEAEVIYWGHCPECANQNKTVTD